MTPPSPGPSPAPPVDTVDALQVGHGLADLQRVQDKSEHLQDVLVSLQVVAQLQEREGALRILPGLGVELGVGEGTPRMAAETGNFLSKQPWGCFSWELRAPGSECILPGHRLPRCCSTAVQLSSQGSSLALQLTSP